MPDTLVHSRYCIRRDWPAILAIEEATFGGWGEADLASLWKRKEVAGRVALACEQIVGFIFYELIPGRVRVLNLAAVTPGARAELIEKVREAAYAGHRRLVWCG